MPKSEQDIQIEYDAAHDAYQVLMPRFNGQLGDRRLLDENGSPYVFHPMEINPRVDLLAKMQRVAGFFQTF